MASAKTLFEIISNIVLLVLVQQNTEAAKLDFSNLLSVLTDKLYGQKQPVVIILDKEHGIAKKDKTAINLLSGSSPETSDEGGVDHLTHHLIGHTKGREPLLQKKDTQKSSRYNKKRQRFRSQRLHKEERSLEREDRDVLSSPIVKKLLRISNSLRCEAKDECQDKCTSKFVGKKEKKCQFQCEIKYVCEEEEDKDPCLDEGCADSCGKSGECKSMSTKGEPLVTEEPGCKRC